MQVTFQLIEKPELIVAELPRAPGRYYWSEWKRVVQVDFAIPFAFGKQAKKRALCVLPFPGSPFPIRISKRIAGVFSGPVPSQN